jgi:hypothetical protein
MFDERTVRENPGYAVPPDTGLLPKRRVPHRGMFPDLSFASNGGSAPSLLSYSRSSNSNVFDRSDLQSDGQRYQRQS